MDLSTNESTLEYLKSAIPPERAHEFIFCAIPLLHAYFAHLSDSQVECFLASKRYADVYCFVEDIMDEFQKQQSELRMKEYRGTKKG